MGHAFLLEFHLHCIDQINIFIKTLKIFVGVRMHIITRAMNKPKELRIYLPLANSMILLL